jgi:adenylate kinase family enzyme
MQILIVGASGSGTTTLGAALALRLGWRHCDGDDYYWLPTLPPYQAKRDAPQRAELLLRDLAEARDAVVSGSVMGWGAAIEDGFDLVVFLYVARELRLQRLRAREIRRHGQADPAFLDWAAQYDEGPPMGRSLAKHEAWLAARQCPVLRIEGDTSVEQRCALVVGSLARTHPTGPR